jgi:hypothetical protein
VAGRVDERHLSLGERVQERPPPVVVALAAVHITVHPDQYVTDALGRDGGLLVGDQGQLGHGRAPADPVELGDLDLSEIGPAHVELRPDIFAQQRPVGRGLGVPEPVPVLAAAAEQTADDDAQQGGDGPTGDRSDDRP